MTKTKTTSATKAATVRKTNLRKNLQSQIRTLQKLRTSLEKTRQLAASLSELSAGFADGSRQQMADMEDKLTQFDIVVSSTIEDRVSAIAHTFRA
jgi:hypothetical protein